MSTVIGRRILSGVCVKGNGIALAGTFPRWRSTAAKGKEEEKFSVSIVDESRKPVIPAAEAGRIQAAVLTKFAGPLIIENVEPPRIKRPDEVLIDVRYCALNGPDLLLSENSFLFQPSLPMILGYEIVGQLSEVGDEAAKAGYKVGDKVIALNKERYGGFAEKCTATVGDIWKVPSNVGSLDAVCLLDNYSTALIGLERRACIQEDDIVIVNVGLGGVGLAAVDLATNVFRAKVIGVCATEDRATLVREKGAFASLKFSDRKLLKQIAGVAAEKNIKAIFDGVGGENFKKVLSCFTDVYKSDPAAKDLLRDDKFAVVVQHLSREGRVVVSGVAATKIEPTFEMQKGSFSITGVSLAEYRLKDHDLYRQTGDEILEFFEEGLISPSYSLITGLHKINNAMQFISEMKSSGKVIIDLKDKEVETESFELNPKKKI